MAHLSTVFGSYNSHGGGLVTFYHSFDKGTFESTVLPYLADNNHSDYALYNHALELVRGMPDPADTPATDIWRWGVWWNALLTIYVNFRKQVKPPPIPSGAPGHLEGAVDLYSLPREWSEELVIPSDNADAFEEFECKFLERKNGKCKIIQVEGKEVAYVPGVLDPFTLYGSAFIVIGKVPPWVPADCSAAPQVVAETPTPPPVMPTSLN